MVYRNSHPQLLVRVVRERGHAGTEYSTGISAGVAGVCAYAGEVHWSVAGGVDGEEEQIPRAVPLPSFQETGDDHGRSHAVLV